VAFPRESVAVSWMRALAEHYDAVRRAMPTQELCIVFDIDGTILDLRHLIVWVALAYDRAHGTDLFRGLVPDDVTASENDVDAVLHSLDVPERSRPDIARFYAEHLWDEAAVLAASAPYRGVLGAIRWFQIQPGTQVALNTGRPESMRSVTLDSLNGIAASARVRFDPHLLFMRDEGMSVAQSKVAALDRIEARGLRVVAVVDNEPENIEAMTSAGSSDVLFLHADTIFESQRRTRQDLVSGTSYELAELIDEEHLRDHVEFVWHGANDEQNVSRFLDSGIRWAEIDLRRDPVGRLVLRHDAFEDRPWDRSESPLYAQRCVETLARAGRSIKLDVKEAGATISGALDLIEGLGLEDDRVWFNAEIQTVGPAGFATFRSRYPRATMSCPTDFLEPLLAAAPEEADRVLHRLRSWGITRLSVRWGRATRRILEELERRGWETNVYAVPDLHSFLEAALLLPTSVTADFNFPEWRYFGRGSGQGGHVHTYEPGGRISLAGSTVP
jgi:hypothetical protein